jgi:hypothetical protein
MASTSSRFRGRKVCFVTIGATAPFDALLSNILDRTFLEALGRQHYTNLLVQFGNEGRTIFQKFINEHPAGSEGRCGLDIQGFDFNKTGLEAEMRSTKKDEKRDCAEGMILSHAGMYALIPETSKLFLTARSRIGFYHGGTPYWRPFGGSTKPSASR